MGFVDGLLDEKIRPACLLLLPLIAEKMFLSSNPKSLILSPVESRCKYPLSSILHREYLKLKDNYMSELKLLHSKLKKDEDEETIQESFIGYID